MAVLLHIKRQFQVEKSKPHAINSTEKERIRLDGIFFFFFFLAQTCFRYRNFLFYLWVTRLGFGNCKGQNTPFCHFGGAVCFTF